ncbi:RNA polymerase sigma factor [Chlorella sorokiniana]|uniref:RNA polymerase sigma factor n=1 Tax=Chlorella sorokiniana TaxID=3076 RepID=A0A2P6TBI4_CHLSO|nr:RNA polymerase sigma factor [Chlorella sorokiniana]|eukprot:PRW05909.1 RNA polymerase sigma factor [Chlorella sorokiniana]
MLSSSGSRLAAQPAPAAAPSGSRRLALRCQAAGLGGPPFQPGRQRVREQSPSKSRAAAAAAAAAAAQLLDAAAAAAGGKPAVPLPPLQPPQAGNVVPLKLPKEERLQQELAQLERHYSLPAVPDLDVLQEAEHWRQRQQRLQQQQQQQLEQEIEEEEAAVLERQRRAAEASTSGRGAAAALQQRSGEVVGSTRSSRGRPAGAAAARRHSSLPDSASLVTCWLHDCATRHTHGRTAATPAAAPTAPAASQVAAAASRRRLLQPSAQPAVPGTGAVSEETCQDIMVLVEARAALRAGRRRKSGKPGVSPSVTENAMGHYMRSLGNTGVLGRAQEARLAAILQKGRALEELAARLAAQSTGSSSSSSSASSASAEAGSRTEQLAVSDEQLAAAAGLSVAEVVQRRTNQREAKDLLMQHNTRLVINIAKRYTNSGVPLSDLIPEGMAGLSKSLDRFEPSRGFKFSTYSHWWIRQAISRAVCAAVEYRWECIRQAISRAVCDQARTVRLPGHICEQLARINRAASAMMEQSESDEFPSYDALAKEVGLPVNRVIHYLRLSRLPGGPATPGGGPAAAGAQPQANGPWLYGSSMKELRPLGDELHDDPEDGWWGEEPEWEAEAAAEFVRGVVDVMLSTLDKRERNVLRLRYGLLGRQQLLGDGGDAEGSDAASMSLGEVAEAYGLSRERIRQIEDKALKALRKPWRQELVRKLAFAEACGSGGHDSAMAHAQAELADEQGGSSTSGTKCTSGAAASRKKRGPKPSPVPDVDAEQLLRSLGLSGTADPAALLTNLRKLPGVRQQGVLDNAAAVAPHLLSPAVGLTAQQVGQLLELCPALFSWPPEQRAAVLFGELLGAGVTAPAVAQCIATYPGAAETTTLAPCLGEAAAILAHSEDRDSSLGGPAAKVPAAQRTVAALLTKIPSAVRLVCQRAGYLQQRAAELQQAGFTTADVAALAWQQPEMLITNAAVKLACTSAVVQQELGLPAAAVVSLATHTAARWLLASGETVRARAAALAQGFGQAPAAAMVLRSPGALGVDPAIWQHNLCYMAACGVADPKTVLRQRPRVLSFDPAAAGFLQRRLLLQRCFQLTAAQLYEQQPSYLVLATAPDLAQRLQFVEHRGQAHRLVARSSTQKRQAAGDSAITARTVVQSGSGGGRGGSAAGSSTAAQACAAGAAAKSVQSTQQMNAAGTAPARGRTRAGAFLLLALFAASAGAIKIGPKPTAPPGVIVKYKSGRGGAAQPSIAAARPGGSALSKAIDPSLNLYRVPVPAGQTASQAAAALAQSDEVEYAYADAYVHIAGGIVDQWALGALRAPQAWAMAQDSSSVLTCVVDTGVKWDHPDLAANLVAATAEFKAAHTDDNGHGTHVAGIIGAVGNNLRGVAGASPRAAILPCKALDRNGWGLISRVIESRGARVINTSFVMGDLDVPLMEAVGNATQAGIFFSAAAGNAGDDTDIYPYYPGNFEFPGVVAVANVAQGDVLAPSSNFGARTCDLAAPGTDVLSTWISPDYNGAYYTKLTGTSMAAPYVSGAAALAITTSGGTLTNAQVAQYLSASSRPVAALRSRVASGGIVNLEQLLKLSLAAKAKAAAAKQQAAAKPA